MSDIKQKYLSTLADLQHITGIAITLSFETHNQKVESWREEYCSYIFAKICLHAQAVLQLSPDLEPRDRYEMESWDISSIATLIRALIDSYYVFYYLGVDEVDDNELEFRSILWDYHAEKQRLDMLQSMQSKNSIISDIEHNVGNLFNKISEHEFYETLTKDKKKKIKQGSLGILHTNSSLSKKAGIDPSYYKVEFNYLSSYVHAYSYAYSQLRDFRINDKSSLLLIKRNLDICTGYLCYAVRDFVSIMPDQENNVDKRAKDLIEIWEHVFKNI